MIRMKYEICCKSSLECSLKLCIQATKEKSLSFYADIKSKLYLPCTDIYFVAEIQPVVSCEYISGPPTKIPKCGLTEEQFLKSLANRKSCFNLHRSFADITLKTDQESNQSNIKSNKKRKLSKMSEKVGRSKSSIIISYLQYVMIT